MTTRPGPCSVVAGSRIDNVIYAVKKCLLPPTNVVDEVAELHDMYLERKQLLLSMDAAHTTLRHLQHIESRKGGNRATRQTRLPRPTVAAANAVHIAPTENVDGVVKPDYGSKI